MDSCRNQIHVELGKDNLFDLVEEILELDRPVIPLDGLAHRPACRVEGGEQ
jgi:hypothetical protein